MLTCKQHDPDLGHADTRPIEMKGEKIRTGGKKDREANIPHEAPALIHVEIMDYPSERHVTPRDITIFGVFFATGFPEPGKRLAPCTCRFMACRKVY